MSNDDDAARDAVNKLLSSLGIKVDNAEEVSKQLELVADKLDATVIRGFTKFFKDPEVMKMKPVVVLRAVQSLISFELVVAFIMCSKVGTGNERVALARVLSEVVNSSFEALDEQLETIRQAREKKDGET